MKIVVCVKRVPDTETIIKIAPDGKSIDSTGIKYIMNPYEEYAVEEALRLKEKFGGTVTIVCLGPSEATKEIRTALAMGADNGIHIVDDNYNGDVYATAKTLVSVLKDLSFDILFFGKMAVDDGSASVGPMVAGLLGLPCISSIAKLEVEDGKVTAEMPVEGGTYVIEASMPVVVTADKALNEPRYPSLRGIMMAKRKKLDSRSVQTVPSKYEIKKMFLPPPRKEGKIVGEGPEAVPELIRLLKEEAKVL